VYEAHLGLEGGDSSKVWLRRLNPEGGP